MVVDDPHADQRWDRLPTSLAAAMQNFEASDFTKRAFGERFVEIFGAMQRHELASFSAHVSDWETARYRDVI